MVGLWGKWTIAVLGAVACALITASVSAAIPWDQGGSIPPGKTPAASSPDPLCEQSYANDRRRSGPRIHFGIGPRLAGETGKSQVTPLVEVSRKSRAAALTRLAGDRSFTVRLNRLFQSDGRRGISRFKRMARHYSRLGLRVEIQVRYHPTPARNGDIGAWVRFVRRVVRELGPIRAVTGLQIANEANLSVSPNTSDGAWEKPVQAVVQGVRAAKHHSKRLGYDQLEIGFNFAWRFGAEADAGFWRELGREGGRRLKRSTDWIGLDLYPGTFSPSRSVITDYGDAFLEALAQVRECYMPMAGFGRRMPLRIEETGWPTGPGRDEAEQKKILRQFVRTAVDYRGIYGITDFRWFGLRDNNSAGPNFQSFYGLLDDRYHRKQAFGEYRRLVARYGAPGPGNATVERVPLRAGSAGWQPRN